jgi:hypothetical protein
MSTTSNVGAFDIRLYQALNKIAAAYQREDPQINWLPAHQTEKLDAYEYKKPIYDESIGVHGTHKIGLSKRQMETPKKYRVYDLEGVEADIYYDMNDMTMEAEYLAQQKAQELAVWANQVKQSYFKGVFTDGFTAAGAGVGQRLNNGIIEQATLVENLNGTDSLLDAAGDVYKALDKIVGSIPFRFRDGRRVIVGCDDLFRRKARTTLFRGATNQMSEFDLFFKELAEVTPPGIDPMVAKPLIVSDKLFLNYVAGTTKTEADTNGTHSRLFAAVVDPEIIEGCFSFYGMVGEEAKPTVRGVMQKWFARLCGCVHQAEAVVYSEQITWA